MARRRTGYCVVLFLWSVSAITGCQRAQPAASTSPPIPEAPQQSRLVQAADVTAQPQPHEDLDATLWMQTSAEYRANTKAIYRTATDRLQVAIADPTWSAIPGIDLEAAADLPPAVILDVDETVLDNSGYQVQLIENGGEYGTDDWHEFVAMETSTAIAGVEEFLDACREAGVKVFFVTNRDVSVELHTRANLQSHGFLGPATSDQEDTVLCKNERSDWTSNKTTRRAHVARSYRVLLLLGDDLNDFAWVGDKPTSSDRRALSAKHDEYWGHKWFPLPNANYGGWERSLYYFQDALPYETKLRKKREALIPSAGGRQPADADGAQATDA